MCMMFADVTNYKILMPGDWRASSQVGMPGGGKIEYVSARCKLEATYARLSRHVSPNPGEAQCKVLSGFDLKNSHRSGVFALLVYFMYEFDKTCTFQQRFVTCEPITK